ncbi:membrane-targeted effector domain-containing toxin [Dyella nitratireducens]|uniref:membrane-targeted effector domain-containing toxin n=1 Tax=Dyella nitratireducens TaxID=1849580 RepID=UPI0016645937|nr:membrane-targeted effector domain-containing toxin [Dyella nitratireducens]
MSTHSIPPLSDGLTPTAHASPPEAASKEIDKPYSPQPQPQPFSSTAPGYVRTPSGIAPAEAPTNTTRTARAAISDSTTIPKSQATDTTTSAKEKELNESLAANSQYALDLIDRRPSFLQAVSTTLFPAAIPPLDLSHVYVNEYSENYIGSFNDYGGTATLKRTWLASHKLTDVLSEALKTGQAPSFLNNVENSYGLFTQPNVVDAGSALSGITPADFKNRLDKLARDPASALQNSTDDYFNKPATLVSGLPLYIIPKDTLSTIYADQFKAEADLRTIDGTLKPEHKALIDRVIAHPNPSAEERKLATTPAVYGVSVITNSTPYPGLTIPGTFLITDNNPVSDKTAGVFYSRTRGIQTFDSLQDFQDHIFKQDRQALLSALSDEDAAKLPSHLDGLHFGLTPLDENVFNYSVKTQLERHKSDTAYAFKDATEKGMTDPNELDMIGRNLSEPLTAAFDVHQMDARRNAAWIEHKRSAWWKSASELDRAELDRLERDAKSKAEALHDAMQEQVPTLHDYAVQRIKDNLQAEYPGADIDPDAIQVRSYAFNRTRVPNKPVSLTQFVLNNVKTKSDLIANPKWNPQWRASFIGKNGELITLLQNDLRSLARDLDVGQGHQDLIRQRMLSSDSNELRQAWKDSYAAQMRVAAKEARLSGALDESGYGQVMALLDHPDSLGKPGEPLQVFYLRIGKSQGGRTGASVEGPLLIAKKNAKSNDPMLLCTLNAPDGIEFKAYLKGMDDLKRDRRFKEEDWQTYFKNRVSENMKPFLDQQFKKGYDIFDRGSTQATSFRKLEDTLYEAHVRRQLADTQTLSKSNQQLDAETSVDLLLLAMDIATSATDIVAPARAALKGLRRLLDPYKAIASLNELPNFARIVQKGAQRPIASMSISIPKRAIGHSALHEIAADHRMNIVNLPGHRQSYLAPKVPDQPGGHYLLRAIDPNHEGQLVSAGIIAKPELRNGKEVWQPKVIRIVAAGGNQPAAGASSGGVGAVVSAPQQGNQVALLAKYNAAPTLKEKQIAFKELYKDFYDNIPTSTYPARPTMPSLGPNATITDLIRAVYRESWGLVLGETHTNVSSIKFLYDNLVNFKRNGVTTLYVEGFDGQWITKWKTKKQRLAVDIEWDRKRYGWPYTMGNLYEKAEELGIRVIGIDNHTFTDSGSITSSVANRLKRMNYWAKTTILLDQQANPGKWVALVGQAHMKTSGRTAVPGLSEILGGIGVEIHPAPKGVPTSVSTPGPGSQTFIRAGNGDFRIDLNIDDVAVGRRPVPA